jgi:eukaryotic-like serine/threonine-protein kinase
MADREPVVLNGRYELHARIARGGMAEVFLARDQVLDRSVAVKVLFPEFATDPAFVERFRREAQSAANLTHPAIVGVYDWGSYRGTYFIVMEYVRGRSLAEILRAEGTLHPDRAADIATDIAGALYFAHRNGVVHRDIKPGNVLITPQGHVKVTDFGIARAVGGNTDNLTQAGSVMGTATYFSPEQAQGLAVDPRSDLYSLGVVLYEMLCGHPPFAGESPVAIAYQHVQGTPTPPRQLDPAIPQALEAITLKLLAKNPANRYATAEDLRADLRRYREGQAVLAEGVLAGPAVVGAAAVAAHGAGAPAGELTNVLAPTVAGPVGAGGPNGADPTALGPSYTGAPNYEPPRRNGVFIAVLVVLLALLGVLLFFFARTVLGDQGDASGQVTVPNVVGKQREEAEAQLQDEGLKASPQFQASAAVEANRVISQQPAADTKVDKDSTVVIVVSQPVATVDVPGVVGQTEEQARTTLGQAGFTNISRSTQEVADSTKKGLVISQNPAAGTKATKDQAIQLVIATGPDQVTLPDVVGLPYDQAVSELVASGIPSGNISRVDQASQAQDAGNVIGTQPSGTVATNQKVQVLVSNGPPTAQVPQVVNLTQEGAERQLQAAGFVVSATSTELKPGDSGIGRVVDQNPAAGETLALGQTVTITVGTQAATTTTSAPSTTTTAKATGNGNNNDNGNR